jgi:hypothetical protein
VRGDKKLGSLRKKREGGGGYGEEKNEQAEFQSLVISLNLVF